MQSSMVKILSILLRYFQDTVSNSIEPCTLWEVGLVAVPEVAEIEVELEVELEELEDSPFVHR